MELSAEQRAQGMDAGLLAIYDCEPLRNLATELAVPLHSVAPKGLRPSALKELYQSVRRANADVVHVHGLLSWVLLTSCFAKHGRWILHVHSYPGGSTTKGRLNWHIARRLFDRVICVSESVRRAIQPLIGSLPSVVVPNGTRVPPKPNSRSPNKTPVFGIVMRLNRDKGALRVPDIAGELRAQCPGAKLLLAGDGDAAAEVASLIQSRGLSEVVDQLGYCGDMPGFWSRVDVSLFISPSDTFGLTIIESLAHGVPVVGFCASGGSDEILREIEGAIAVESTEPTDLVRTALKLYSEKSRLSELRVRGMRAVRERYAMSDVAAKITDIYEEALG
jgi:glycosyltransferase involved in cell wall biosynthesis